MWCFVQVAFEPSELQLAGGSPPLKQQESEGDVLERMFEVLYLDDRVRVVNFIKKDDPPVLFVFERIAAKEDVEEESGTAGSLGEVRAVCQLIPIPVVCDSAAAVSSCTMRIRARAL